MVNFDIWVQLHNIPLMCMNRKMAGIMANQIGEVVDIPAEPKDCRGRYLKVRVRLDVNKPLRRALRLNLEGSEEVSVVLLRYERLPEFCFACGRIGHNSKDCMDEAAKTEALQGASMKYGSWMRASQNEGVKEKFSSQGERNDDRIDRLENAIVHRGQKQVTGRDKIKPSVKKGTKGSDQMEINHKTTEGGSCSHADQQGFYSDPVDPTSEGKELVEGTHPLLSSGAFNTVGEGIENSLTFPSVFQNPKEIVEGNTQKVPMTLENSQDIQMTEIRQTRTSPAKKNSKKWKRAAREIPILGKISSPIQKMINVQQQRKNRRGNSLSPEVYGQKGGESPQSAKDKGKQAGKELKSEKGTGQKRKKLVFDVDQPSMIKKIKCEITDRGTSIPLSAEPGTQVRRSP